MELFINLVLKYPLFAILICVVILILIYFILFSKKTEVGFKLFGLSINFTFEKERKNNTKTNIKNNERISSSVNTIEINDDKNNKNVHKENIVKEDEINYFETGKDFYKNKNYSEAIIQFTEVINNDKNNIEAYFYRGKSFYYNYVSLQKIKELNNAIEDFEEVIKNNKEHSEAHLYLGKCYRIKSKIAWELNDKRKYYNLAHEELVKVITAPEEQCNNVDIKYKNIFELKNEAHMDKGLLHFDMFLYESEKASYITMPTDDLYKAIDDFSKVISKDNNNFDAYLYRGHLYYYCARVFKYKEKQDVKTIKKYEENIKCARDDYTENIRLKPFLEELYLFRGLPEDIITFIKMVPNKNDYEMLKKKLNASFFIVDKYTDEKINKEFKSIDIRKTSMNNKINKREELNNIMANKENKYYEFQIEEIKKVLYVLDKEIAIMQKENEIWEKEIELMKKNNEIKKYEKILTNKEKMDLNDIINILENEIEIIKKDIKFMYIDFKNIQSSDCTNIVIT